MNELTLIKNYQEVTSSLIAAEQFGKEHKHVLESIRSLAAENSTARLFEESSMCQSKIKAPQLRTEEPNKPGENIILALTLALLN